MRHSSKLKPLVLFPALPGVLVLSACTATGGGTLPAVCASSAAAGGPGPVATFGFAYDDGSGTLAGNYQDTCAGVLMTGSGRLAPTTQNPPAAFQAIGPGALVGCAAGDVTYQSQNRAKPGSGTASVFACGFSGLLETFPFDYVQITMNSGPFAGYSNLGFLQNGTLVVR